MIYYFARVDNLHTITRYLGDWAKWMKRRFCVETYEALPAAESLPDATFIFTDIERLPAEATARAVALWDALEARGPQRVRLLNHPGRVLRRYELLRGLHERGWNRFNVYRLDEARGSVRYPVFLRSRTEHRGNLTPLLPDAAAVERAIPELERAGWAAEGLLISEFLDTSQDGIYRKYSATRAGDLILAHHLMFQRDWRVKGPSLKEPAMLVEDRVFRETNPHAAQLRELFEFARTDYGRMDYAMLDGRIQLWEINTNPTPLYAPRHYTAAQNRIRRPFTRRLNQVFLELDDRSPADHTPWGRLVRLIDRLR
jgi:hypothetical protein